MRGLSPPHGRSPHRRWGGRCMRADGRSSILCGRSTPRRSFPFHCNSSTATTASRPGCLARSGGVRNWKARCFRAAPAFWSGRCHRAGWWGSRKTDGERVISSALMGIGGRGCRPIGESSLVQGKKQIAGNQPRNACF